MVNDNIHVELRKAAEEGDIQKFEALRKQGADVKATGTHWWTVLHRATSTGQLQMVEHLLKNKLCDIQATTEDHETPAHLAAQNGHIPVLKFLLNNPYKKISSKDLKKRTRSIYGNHHGYGYTPLLLAAAHGKVEMYDFLIKSKEAGLKDKDIKERNDNEDSALLLAAYGGHKAMVEYLLTNKLASVQERNKQGKTALLLAAHSGNVELVDYLLKHTASQINEKDKDGHLAVHMASMNGQVDMLEYFFKNKLSDFSERNHEGSTLLMLASYRHQIKTVNYFLARPEVNLLEQNLAGHNVLSIAFHDDYRDDNQKKYEVVRRLISIGAYSDLKFNTGQMTGQTLCEFLIRFQRTHKDPAYDYVAAAEILLLYTDGCRKFDDYDKGRSATPISKLYFSCDFPNEARNRQNFTYNKHFSQNEKFLLILEALGTGLNARRALDGNTALNIAILNKDYTMIRTLLARGASLEIRNHASEIALTLACKSDDPLIRILVLLPQIEAWLSYLKQTLGKADYENANTNLNLLLSRVLEIIDLLPPGAKGEEYFKLGRMMGDHTSPAFQPIAAYKILSDMTDENPLYPSSHETLFRLMMGGFVAWKLENEVQENLIVSWKKEQEENLGLEPDEQQEQGIQKKILVAGAEIAQAQDPASRNLNLKMEIRHLLLSNTNDEVLLGKLLAQYVLGDEHSVQARIPGIRRADIESQMALIDKMREDNLELEKLKKEIAALRKENASLIEQSTQLKQENSRLKRENDGFNKKCQHDAPKALTFSQSAAPAAPANPAAPAAPASNRR